MVVVAGLMLAISPNECLPDGRLYQQIQRVSSFIPATVKAMIALKSTTGGCTW